MLPSERARLAIYDFVETAGQGEWRPTDVPTLSQATGCRPWPVLVDLLKRLFDEVLIDLRWRPGGIVHRYSDPQFTEDDFFRAPFEIKVTSKGRDDKAHLEGLREAVAKDVPEVFISCGQYRAEEIELGRALATTVDELLKPAQGYFAENQSSLEALSQHVFGALNRCVGFVAVMHHRGIFQTPNKNLIRASVWIEQEIAIVSFLTQVYGRKIPVALYIQEGIALEGVRQQLLLNATEYFTESSQVLQHFRSLIQSGKFTMLPK